MRRYAVDNFLLKNRDKFPQQLKTMMSHSSEALLKEIFGDEPDDDDGSAGGSRRRKPSASSAASCAFFGVRELCFLAFTNGAVLIFFAGQTTRKRSARSLKFSYAA